VSKLHIIIPVLNCLDYTKQAIESIKTATEYSIHIVDQDSNDGTRQFCENRQNDKFWYHRYSPKVSLSEAWNRGVREALSDPECEYLFVINNDVIFHPETIDNLIESLHDTGYSMVTCNNIAPNMTIDQFKDMKIDTNKDHDMRPITNWREEGPDFSGFLITKKTIDEIGYFDENYYPAYYEDNDYHIRILKAGKHAKRISRAPFYHFGSMTTVKNPGLSSTSSITRGKFIEKWGAEPAMVMDGKGFNTPYNEGGKDHKFWRGNEKYKT